MLPDALPGSLPDPSPDPRAVSPASANERAPARRVGVPREVKSGEARVGLTPAEVRQLHEGGCQVLVERDAGRGVGFDDADYRAVGAAIVATAGEVYGGADVIAKVKEIQPAEFALLRRGQVICGFAQVARDPLLLDALLDAGVSVVAYEAIRDGAGRLPVLAPMSDIAGRLSASVAQWCLHSAQGGAGVLLDAGSEVAIVGAGVAGLAAAEAFHRIGCDVTLLLRDEVRARRLAARLPAGVRCTALATLDDLLPRCQVLVGAVSVAGELSPQLISRVQIGRMPRGAVFIDIGIDMGGISETSRQTSWAAPIFVDAGVVHFCVPNMPAQVPKAATAALAAAAYPYVAAVARQGLLAAARDDTGLAGAVQVHAGGVSAAKVARDTRRAHLPLFA